MTCGPRTKNTIGSCDMWARYIKYRRILWHVDPQQKIQKDLVTCGPRTKNKIRSCHFWTGKKGSEMSIIFYFQKAKNNFWYFRWDSNSGIEHWTTSKLMKSYTSQEPKLPEQARKFIFWVTEVTKEMTDPKNFLLLRRQNYAVHLVLKIFRKKSKMKK